jgi:hypothetical protein
MVSPINGYSPRVVTAPSRLDSSLQPFAVGAPGLPSPSDEPRFAQQGNPIQAGSRLSLPNVALLETMQAGRETSVLLSSMMSPGDRAFTAPSPFPIMPRGQFPPRSPNVALLETMQTGRETSVLLSSMVGSAPGMRSNASPFVTRTQGENSFASPQADLSSAVEIFGAKGRGQPYVEDSHVAQEAYLMETKRQSHAEQWLMGSNPMHEWFA